MVYGLGLTPKAESVTCVTVIVIHARLCHREGGRGEREGQRGERGGREWVSE